MLQKILPTFMLLAFTASCKKDAAAPLPTPAPEFVYQSNDSMRLTAQVQSLDPQLYSDFNNKTYAVTSNRVTAVYTAQAGDVVLNITDSSVVGYETAVSLRFKNKSIASVSGTYNLQGNGEVCVQMWQNLGRTPGSSSWATSAGCEPGVTGVVNLQYDAANQTMSGSVEKLSYRFGYYIPFYLNGNSQDLGDALWLTSSGSTRTQSIRFKYVRRG